MSTDPMPGTIRVDKWLWHARFAKTRAVAADVVKDGLRLNGKRIVKPATQIRPGDVLTFAVGDRVRVVKIVSLGTRRGPATEAQTLYDDLSPAPSPSDLSAPKSTGRRPDKRDRRRFAAPGQDPLD